LSLPSKFPHRTPYEFPFTPTCARCPAHLIILDLITLIISGERYNTVMYLCVVHIEWKKFVLVQEVTAERGSRVMTPIIRNFCTIWRWVVSFMPRPVYLQAKNAGYPLNRICMDPHSRSGSFWKRETYLALSVKG
jgi:hypothetical protein